MKGEKKKGEEKKNHSLIIKAKSSQAYNSYLWVSRLGEFAFGCPTPLTFFKKLGGSQTASSKTLKILT